MDHVVWSTGLLADRLGSRRFWEAREAGGCRVDEPRAEFEFFDVGPDVWVVERRADLLDSDGHGALGERVAVGEAVTEPCPVR